MRNTQIFLKDRNIMSKIVASAELNKDDIVLEIGSGDGRLTRELAEKAARVYAVERDLNLLDSSKIALKELKNVELINADALEIDFPEDVTKIVSNLPYAISSPVTTKIVYFLNKRPNSFAILMYQKEFGERMLSIPGIRDYSMLSVFCQYTCDIERIINVNKACFRPMPSVDSIVIKLSPKRITIDEGFLAFCRAIFQHKKKNLYSAILDSREKMALHTKPELKARLEKLDESFMRRKVFLFEVDELLNIYKEMVKLGICQK